MRAVLLVALMLSACYSPQLRECVVACTESADCVAPYVCGSDGLCASSEHAGRCASVLVDSGTVDTMTDARSDAAPGCVSSTCSSHGGSCLGDRCVIDRDNSGGVMCPPGMPCTVVCNAQDACKNGVDCGGATSCIVECTAAAACQDKGVDCGSAQTCTVTCRGASACQHGDSNNASVECRSSTCSVTCDGDGACQDGIDAQGTCTSHCCQDACEGGTGPCSRDSVCN